MQKEGIGYNQIFVLVAIMILIFILLVLILIKDLEVHQIDVKVFFLNRAFEEEIFTYQL